MDKETAVELAKNEARHNAQDKRQNDQDDRIAAIEEIIQSCQTLIKQAVIKVVRGLLAVGVMGLAVGWHLPENLRKAFVEWISK